MELRIWSAKFELEFGDISVADRLGEYKEADEELEGLDEELGDEELESPDDEFETVDEEFESLDGDQEAGSEYVERFMELASRGYESETELDEEVNRVLGEMEREYFWGKLKSLAKKGLRTGAAKLFKAAKGIAGNHPLFKALQGLTSLHRKGLRGLLSQLATTAAAGTPFGGAAMAALKALDFKPGEPNTEREAWENFVNVSREAYENLAENLNEAPKSLAGAQQQAVNSLTTALRNNRTRAHTGPGRGRRRVIRLRPGQRITIVCKP